MTSQIDPMVPVFGAPTTASVRNNFLIAKNEIEAIQAQIAGGGGGGSGFGPPINVAGSGTITLATLQNYFVFVNNTTGSPITVTLPSGVVVGQQLIIKDTALNAGIYNITVAAPATIDNNPTYPLMSNGASLSVVWTGSEWGTF